MILKKAAMFGLDARIALAIFGALSVISGAALFNAIQQAKTEQLRQYFVEFVKASEQYYLDTGEMVRQHDIDNIRTSYLYENTDSLAGWSGPYLTATSTSLNHVEDAMTATFPPTTLVGIWLQRSSNWTSNTIRNACVSDSTDCAEWIVIAGDDRTKLSEMENKFELLDELVDGGDGALAGKVRFNTNSVADTLDSGWIMYQGIPRKNLM